MEYKLWSRLTRNNFLRSHIAGDRLIYEFRKLTIYVRPHITKIGFDEDGNGCMMIPVNDYLARQIKKKLQGLSNAN